MIFLMKPGPAREIVRIVLGVMVIVIGLIVTASSLHWILIAAGAVLIVVGVVGGLREMRKRTTTSP